MQLVRPVITDSDSKQQNRAEVMVWNNFAERDVFYFTELHGFYFVYLFTIFVKNVLYSVSDLTIFYTCTAVDW